jgi:hypothetical protein
VKPPAETGPISLTSHNCHRFPAGGQVCAFVYVLDPAATTDPKATWKVYWVNETVAATASSGTCTTAFAAEFEWGTGGRPGPRPAATYPFLGAAHAVAPGSTVRLVVNAGGRAKTAAELRQRTSWPRGRVRAWGAPGQVLALWEGATAGAVPFTSAAEVRNPGDEFGGGVTADYEVQAPCARVPPAAPGYLARVVPAAAHTAVLQLRIPGFHPLLNRKSSLITWAGEGKATYTVTRNGMRVGASTGPITIGGRGAILLVYPPGRYVVQVTLRGPGASRNYRLPFRIA